MSTRHIRKYLGGNVLPPPEDDSDYEPLYASTSTRPAENKFNGLVKSETDSEAEPEPERDANNKEAEEEVEQVQKPKKKNKGKKKSLKKKPVADTFELDEIDRSLQEVNALLGTPLPAPVAEAACARDKLFKIEGKHLNPANELRRLLGPDEDEIKTRRKRGANYVNRGLIVQPDDSFRKVGITMSMSPVKSNEGQSFFFINHDQTYQERHKSFINILLVTKEDFPPIDIGYMLENMYVEGLLQMVDLFFAMEEYDRAKKILEKTVSYLQFISHPLFRITSRDCRLEYKVLENRLYHVAMLKYIYVMTNSACHRTGLEIAKVLLNLDPSDPLALIILIDTLALRAREHQWLIDVVDYWKIHRDADFMFNLLYSYALSHFHVIRKKKGDFAEADKHLQTAMKRFPMVVPELVKAINTKIPQMDGCEMFIEKTETPQYIKNLWQDLIKYYTMFTASKWREPEVCAWFTRNVVTVVEEFNEEKEVWNFVQLFAQQREALRVMPTQIIRHFQVIKYMNNFVFDESNVFTARATLATYNPEPYPSDTVNRYGYRFEQQPRAQIPESIVGGFIRSLGPEFHPVRPEDMNLDANPDDDPERAGEPTLRELLRTVQYYFHTFDDDDIVLESDDDRWDFVLPD